MVVRGHEIESPGGKMLDNREKESTNTTNKQTPTIKGAKQCQGRGYASMKWAERFVLERGRHRRNRIHGSMQQHMRRLFAGCDTRHVESSGLLRTDARQNVPNSLLTDKIALNITFRATLNEAPPHYISLNSMPA